MARKIKGLGLCSGGLDSILSALLLKEQNIDVTWISFQTPFFSSDQAKKASEMTSIPLIVNDITDIYLEMLKNPKAGYGKNMNPCMDCHALMFEQAGKVMKAEKFDFLFSGEVLGQRPKSQNKNSLRYVEKNSGCEGHILRPLSAQLLEETTVEKKGLVDRAKLGRISGRSRKAQMEMARTFGIKEYPAPAGGCLLTDRIFSDRLRDLMFVQKSFQKNDLYLLRYGRHFRFDENIKVIVGRSQKDNEEILKYFDKNSNILLKHSSLAGPDVIISNKCSEEMLEKAAQLCTSYTKALPGEDSDIRIISNDKERILTVKKIASSEFKDFLI